MNSAGCSEIYDYDHTGDRALTHRSGCGPFATVRHRFGSTEIFSINGNLVTGSTVDTSLAATPVIRVTREGGVSLELEHLFHDVLGSLLATTDTSGKGTARLGYGASGEVLYAEGPGVDRYDRRFNGKADDTPFHLRYYGARYYDPLTPLWTQADPFYRFRPDSGVLQPRQMSPYTFSLNNPMRYIDPDGLQAVFPQPPPIQTSHTRSTRRFHGSA